MGIYLYINRLINDLKERIAMMLYATRPPLFLIALFISTLFFHPFSALGEVKVERGRLLPLLFEKNEGQVDASVLYFARGADCTFYFRSHDILLLLKKDIEEGKSLFFPLKMEFVGASRSQARGEEENDSEKLRYQEIYPGMDLLFYGNSRQLDYDIVVSPGAHPETIRLRFQGIDPLSITPTGDLRILISGGEELLLTKPCLYQIETESRISIDGQFVQLGPKEVGFAFGEYDLDRTLTMNLTLVYSTYLGSDQAIALGATRSCPFPTLPGALQPNLNANALQSASVSKRNATGTSLVYSTHLGGDHFTGEHEIVWEDEDEENAYLAGFTPSTEAFQETPGEDSGEEERSPVYPSASSLEDNHTEETLLFPSSYFEENRADSRQGKEETNSPEAPTTAAALPGGVAAEQKGSVPKPVTGAPLILSLDPNQGPISGGTTLLLTGAHFEGVTAVYFGGTAANFKIDSDTQITALSPPGAATVNVTVVTPLGTSCISPTDLFTYVQLKRITVTTLTASPNPADHEESIALTVAVAPSSATGTLSFFDHSTLLGTVSLMNGTAHMSVFPLSVGTHHLTAVYSGDTNHFASTSLSVTVIVSCPPPSLPLLPPIHLKGTQITRKFATQKERVNILTWKAPQEGEAVVAYGIYRDSKLEERIANISSKEQLRFEEHHRRKGKTYRYFIVSIDAHGNHSVPGEVMIRERR